MLLRSIVRHVCSVAVALSSVAAVMPAHANEIWVVPTHQADFGGLGVASNVFWPATPVGAVRLALAIPDDLQSFQSAKVAIIPRTPGGNATLNVFVCTAQNGEAVGSACAGPVAHAFAGVPNQLTEVDISAAIAPKIGVPGATYLTVVAYSTPTTATDQIVGLRFTYAPAGGIAAGMVAFFAAPECPSSWTPYTAAQGRVVVGLPSGGTVEGTVGSQLANLGARTITEVPSHLHSIDPPSASTSQSGSHTHGISAGTGAGFVFNRLTVGLTGEAASESTNTAGNHTHNVDIAAFNSFPAGSASVDVSMPYIQLIACRKS